MDLVLDVVDLTRLDDLAMRFVICGDGPELGVLVAEAQRRQMDGWVHFLRHVENPGRMLLESDVVLNSSDSEGGMPFPQARRSTTHRGGQLSQRVEGVLSGPGQVKVLASSSTTVSLGANCCKHGVALLM